MSRWLMSKIALIAMAASAPARASDGETQPLVQFPTEQSAREYLKVSPAGPLAQLAFLALVEYRLIRQNPGMTPQQAMALFAARPAGKAPTGTDVARSGFTKAMY